MPQTLASFDGAAVAWAPRGEAHDAGTPVPGADLSYLASPPTSVVCTTHSHSFVEGDTCVACPADSTCANGT